MVAYTKPQQRKKESERLRGDRDQIKIIDLRFERWQVLYLGMQCNARTPWVQPLVVTYQWL